MIKDWMGLNLAKLKPSMAVILPKCQSTDLKTGSWITFQEGRLFLAHLSLYHSDGVVCIAEEVPYCEAESLVLFPALLLISCGTGHFTFSDFSFSCL